MRFSQFFSKVQKMRIAQHLTFKKLIIYVQNIFQNEKKNQGKNMHDNLSSCADIAGNQ